MNPDKSEIMKKALIPIVAMFVALSFSLRADTAENWQKHCAKCHGPDGKGETKMGKKAGVKDMTEAAYQTAFDAEKAFKSVKEGLKAGTQEKMKPAKDLTDDEIKALVAHIRTFKK